MNEEVTPLVVKDLHKSFKQGNQDVEILKGITFSAKKGEFIAIMGPSGSGKSTLLHVIAGLTGMNSGTLTINDENIVSLSDAQLTALRRRKVGFIFQSFNLIPTLNVEDNILLPVLTDGQKPDMKRLQFLVERLGIADKMKRRPTSLSGGEQQRVAIARALLPSPAIILADEPTGSLDTVSGQKLCQLLSSLCKEDNCTLLMVTHEPSVAIWTDRTLVLRDGVLLDELSHKNIANAHELAAAYQDLLSLGTTEA